MKKQLWLLLALVIGVTMWAAPALAAEQGETYLPLCYSRDNAACTADETNFYWTDSENVWQAPRQGGEPQQIYAAHVIRDLTCADGNLYFIADDSLVRYDTAAGKAQQLAAWATKPAAYQGSVYYLKCINTWHLQLCRQPAAGGTEQMLADYAARYWFNEGCVCWLQETSTPEHGSGFVGSLPLGALGNAPAQSYYTYAFDWADGWYYCLDVVITPDKYGQGKLYRWRWQNGRRDNEQILLLPSGSTFDKTQVVDGTFYYTMRVIAEYAPWQSAVASGSFYYAAQVISSYAPGQTEALTGLFYYIMQVLGEYTPGQTAVSTSPLYAYDIEADGLPRQLTDCKVDDFYVFGEQVVYKEARWYDGTWPEWQVLQ